MHMIIIKQNLFHYMSQGIHFATDMLKTKLFIFKENHIHSPWAFPMSTASGSSSRCKL